MRPRRGSCGASWPKPSSTQPADFEGPLGVRVEDKRQGPPGCTTSPRCRNCAPRFGWSAAKTLEVAQELYDGQGKKIITYPRAEVRYLPESLIADVPKIVAGLQVGQSFKAIPVPVPPLIRRGASGTFHEKGLEGASHHAVIPNVNTVDTLREVWPRLSIDEKKLFDVIARAYLAALMPDFRYRQTTATLDVKGFPFKATGRQPLELGWRAAFPEWQPADEKGDGGQLLPAMRDGEPARLRDPEVETKETKPAAALQRRHADRSDAECVALRGRRSAARPAEGGQGHRHAGDPRGDHRRAEETGVSRRPGQEHRPHRHRAETVRRAEGGRSGAGRPGQTAQLECLLDDVVVGKQQMAGAVDAVCDVARRIIGKLTQGAVAGGPLLLGGARGTAAASGHPPPR